MQIGQKLKGLRIAKNLTQEELADRAELSKGFNFTFYLYFGRYSSMSRNQFERLFSGGI